MEDAEAGRQSKAQVPFEATENSRPMTDLFGEKVHEGRVQQPRKKRATRQPETGSRDWPEPELIAVEFGSAQPYPVECWGPLRNVIDVINDKTGVGFEVAAASLIPSVALLAQTDYRAVTLGADAPLGIYMMGLVSSGGRKTTSYQLAFKAHIDADENVLARYEAALDTRKKRSREEDGGGEEPRYPRREPPHALHTDVTKAALIKGLSLGRPAQCLAASDAGVVMGNWSGRGPQAVETFQTLTTLWDGNVHTLDRMGVGFRLAGRTLSVAWMAQTKFAAWLFSELGEQGLSSRFLVCSDDHWKAPRITDEEIESRVAAEAANQGTPPVEPALQTFWDVIAAARRTQDEGMEYHPGPDRDSGDPPELIRRTPDALRLLLYYGRDTSGRAANEEGAHVRGFLRRAPEHASRLAALMVAWGRYSAEAPAATGLAGPIPSASIDEGAMQRAVTLVNWYAGEMNRISDHAGYTRVATLANRLSRILSKAAAGEILQNSNTGRGYLTSGGHVQVRTLIAQRMKNLAKDPALQERVLRVLQRQEHIRMLGGTQCEVNPGLRKLYMDG